MPSPRPVESLTDTPLGTPTFFEAANAIAFTRFAAAALDYAVVETGIGGLLDATNTITRSDKLAVLTRIGLDHTNLLGDTVAEIAAHKAGILPTGGHGVVLRHHQARVRATIAETARRKRCHLDVLDPRDVSCTVDPAGTVLHLGDTQYPLGLQGHHQGVNAALALRAARYLAQRDGWTLDPAAIRTGLASTWPARQDRATPRQRSRGDSRRGPQQRQTRRPRGYAPRSASRASGNVGPGRQGRPRTSTRSWPPSPLSLQA